MKIVVDTNIVFSTILNTQSKIGQILIGGAKKFEFYSINLLKEEIKNHQNKILNISGYSISKYEEIYQTVTSKISFINDILLSNDSINSALEITQNIDENDTLFVALTNELNATLWPGDKKLSSGLNSKGYDKCITT